ncbi:MAG: cysteine--tRNA ligase [Kiritimatiellaeota bacterium]|nr:cysteine--tRNA ligase [Kiritimatiellota bacterium]
MRYSVGMTFYNSLTRREEEFSPLEKGRVKLYTCGPTVYNFAHIGNFRAYVFEDVLRRTLKLGGFSVTQVMNLTDVDDKTIRSSRTAGMALSAFTKQYKDAFFADLKTLNIEPAEFYPAATDHIPGMIRLIQTLLDKGVAYRSEDGSIYFSVAKFPEYGKLAHIDPSQLKSGARVAQDEYEKESFGDFALWKAWDEADGDVVWDAPWGKGRPGWHIECSAMGMEYLGESYDIHTGGVDNLFPHHENEIAQSEAATGKPFVHTWIHCAHLRVNGEKMSKSLGNFYTLRDLLDKGYTGREIRYVLLSAHYRQPLNFTFDALAAARSALGRLDALWRRSSDLRHEITAGGNPLPAWAETAQKAFADALFDDLNTPEALAAFHGMIHHANKALDAGMTPQEAHSVLAALQYCDRVLGIMAAPATEATIPADIQKLADERAAARKAKDFAASDRLRNAIAAAGWDVKDTPQGQKLRKI